MYFCYSYGSLKQKGTIKVTDEIDNELDNQIVTVKENGETVKLNIKNSKVPEPPSAPESPKTGDTANLLIPLITLFTAFGAIIYLSKKLKKRGYINE